MEFTFYIRFVKKARERNLGKQTLHEAFSLAVDISGGALLKDVPPLFKARRYKNTCHHVRVAYKGARDRTIWDIHTSDKRSRCWH